VKSGAQPPTGESPTYLFGDFRLDLQRRKLYAGSGTAVEVTPRVLETLICLVQHRGALLTREQLMDTVWSDVAVEPNNLNQSVAKLRRLLGEAPGENRFIETVPGRGYRFIAPVKVLPAAEPAQERTLLRDAEADMLTRQALRFLQRPTPDNCRAAIERLEQATALESGAAIAWAWLADARLLAFNAGFAGVEVLDTIEAHAERALALEPRTGLAHTILGVVRAHRRNWTDAETHFRLAESLNTSDAMAHTLHASFLLLAVGHVGRTLEHLRMAFRIAPDDPRMLMNLAMAHCVAGDDTEAQRCAALAVGFGYPEHAAPLPLVHVYAAARAGDYSSAIAHANGVLGANGISAGVAATVFSALEDRSNADSARAMLHGVVASTAAIPRAPGVTTLLLAWITQLGDLTLAFELANRAAAAAEAGGRPVSWQGLWSPELRAFRADARFGDLAARLRFTDYWNSFGRPDA
jgi:DNA-binding winged helix-turn-helix (wHTH) protein